jgi:uncharacterized protein involved in outer membrane biogenesis
VIGLAIAVRVILGGDRIKSAIEAQASAALGRPVTIGSATPRLFPRVGLELSGVAVGSGREVTIDRIRLTTGLGALVRRRVAEAQISIERSTIDTRWALAFLAALADSSTPTAPSPATSSALAVESIESLSLRDVTLLAGNRAMLVDLDSSLATGDRFVISRMVARSGAQARDSGFDFRASGEFTSIERRTGTFNIEAGMLDLDGLLAFLAAATPAGSQGIAARKSGPVPQAAQQPMHVDIAVRAKKGRILGVDLAGLSTTVRMRGGTVGLEDLQVSVFGGRFAGSGALRPSADAARSEYEWRGTLENIDVPQVVAFAGTPGSMTGRLAGSLGLKSVGVDPQDAMTRARGTAGIAITDGRIQGLEVVRSVVLAFGKPSGERPAGSGEAFTRLSANLAVNGANVSTNDLAFASRDFDMAGQGNLSLASQRVDFRTDIVLSRELSAQAGRDLYRVAREGDRVVVPARITGTVSSPTVFVDVQDALKRAIRNRAEDELKSLFDRWRKKPIKN